MNGSTSLVLDDLSQRVLAPDFPWQRYRPGVDIFHLHDGGTNALASALLRYEPGARIPRHRHQGHEHVFILAGSQVDARGTHRAGTLVVNAPDSVHEVTSPDGCIVYIVWERPVAFEPSEL